MHPSGSVCGRGWSLLNCHLPGHNEPCKMLHCRCKLVDVSRGRSGTDSKDIAMQLLQFPTLLANGS